MTYKEFEKRVKDLNIGFYVDEFRKKYYVKSDATGTPCASVGKVKASRMNADWGQDIPAELFDLCVELAKTPLEDREEPKKYWVRNNREDSMLFRSRGKVCDSIGVSIWSQEDRPERYQFTEQEIKNHDERYWAFAVEVE